MLPASGGAIRYNYTVMETLRAYLNDTRFRQWTLINAAGWAAGLLFGGAALILMVALALLTGSSLPFIGLALGGAIIGLCVGVAQKRLLRLDETEAKRWIGASAVGGAIGALPAVLASFITRANWLLGFALVGVLFGVIVGAVQWYVLRQRVNPAGVRWWLAAYALGGMLCGVITLSPPHPLLLPVCCSLGTLVMGAATGTAVVRMLGDGGVEG
jgi:hypothetical protein